MKNKLIEGESRMVVARGWQEGVEISELLFNGYKVVVMQDE